jgi:hypothetical protein
MIKEEALEVCIDIMNEKVRLQLNNHFLKITDL